MSSVAGHTQDTTPDVATSGDSRCPGNDTESVQRGQESSNVVKAGLRSRQAEFKLGQRQIRGQGRQSLNKVKGRSEVRSGRMQTWSKAGTRSGIMVKYSKQNAGYSKHEQEAEGVEDLYAGGPAGIGQQLRGGARTL